MQTREMSRKAGPLVPRVTALLPIGAYEPRWFMKNQLHEPL
jgi:hypothetical protein